MAFVLGILLIAGTVYLSPAITGTSSSTVSISSSPGQQTTTFSTTTQSSITSATTTQQFVPSPATAETTNSTSGLELTLSVSSTVIPSEDAINVSASTFNTLAEENNLSASSDWRLQGLLEQACPITNSDAWPVALVFFAGNYGNNNISNALPIFVWGFTECVVSHGEYTAYSFLPTNNSAYIAGGGYDYAPRIETQALVWAANSTVGGHFNSLSSSLPGSYTIAAGNEWGQIVLLHFQVVASNILPRVGSFVAAPSTSAGCYFNGNPTFCITNYQSGAFVFNCASEAAGTAGCTVYTVYTITVWNPFVNQPNETSGANCKFSVQGDPYSPHYGSCFFINSTAFFIYDPS